jgi:hypothetical protein
MPETPTKAFRRGAGRVAFLANKDLFRSLLDQGYPRTVIYADYADKLGITYWQFNRYVKAYLIETESENEQQNEVSSSSASPSPSGGEKPERSGSNPGAQKPEAKRPGQVGRKFEHKSVPDDKLV